MRTIGFYVDRPTKSRCFGHRLKISRASSRKGPVMSIASPQPRVRRSPFLIVGSARPIGGAWARAAVMATAAAILGLAGGCSSRAQTPKSDASVMPDGSAKPDASAKPDGSRTIQDAGGGDGRAGETGGSAIGEPCTDGATCASGFCADGVCCQTACDGACLTCAATGTVGTCI